MPKQHKHTRKENPTMSEAMSKYMLKHFESTPFVITRKDNGEYCSVECLTETLEKAQSVAEYMNAEARSFGRTDYFFIYDLSQNKFVE
jgi:predicted Fe-Mo cluster-binding NifX family protein